MKSKDIWSIWDLKAICNTDVLCFITKGQLNAIQVKWLTKQFVFLRFKFLSSQNLKADNIVITTSMNNNLTVFNSFIYSVFVFVFVLFLPALSSKVAITFVAWVPREAQHTYFHKWCI